MSIKMEHPLKIVRWKWNIELGYGTAESITMEKRQSARALQQRLQPKREISQALQVGLATVNRDVSYLRHQAKANIKRYIDERLPEEYGKCLVGLNAITKAMY
jgi:hypothetical protein